ncbi:uncharacterized protein LOC143435063 [Arvicanthis niloticus]|uniref:uncharacterized protein LOC143309416 n=1 Tax=Arvicanthis niloticus TaxID=61156 RepID=UPI00402B825C
MYGETNFILKITFRLQLGPADSLGELGLGDKSELLEKGSRVSRTCPQPSIDKAKKMIRFCPSFVKDPSDPEELALLSEHVFPALSTRCSKSEPGCFCGESSHYSENGWIVDWGLYLDYLRYYHRLNYAVKRGTEVFSESQRELQVSPGDDDNDNCKDIEKPEELSTWLLREKGLELETCDGGDCPDQDPAIDSARHLGCWAWLQRAFGQKKK